MNITRFLHNARVWQIVWLDGHFFAKDDRDCLTGPYSTAEDAEVWVREIRP